MKPTSGSGSESKLYVICSQQILCAMMAVVQEKWHVRRVFTEAGMGECGCFTLRMLFLPHEAGFLL